MTSVMTEAKKGLLLRALGVKATYQRTKGPPCGAWEDFSKVCVIYYETELIWIHTRRSGEL
jgi:hypothetical protein